MYGDGLRVLGTLFVISVVLAVVAGVLSSESELINPSIKQAEAGRINAETEALRAQTAYEEQQRALEFEKAEQQAAYDQQQRELYLREEEQRVAAEAQALYESRMFKAELYEVLARVLPVAGAIALLCPGLAAAYYWIKKGAVLARTHPPTEGARAGTRPYLAKVKGNAPPIQRANISVCSPSRNGFLAFNEDFVLTDDPMLPSILDYGQPDSRRRYYPNGIAPDLASVYLDVLRRNGIVALSSDGSSEWVRCRQPIDLCVISRWVSDQDFDEIVRTGSPFGRIEFEHPAARTRNPVAEPVPVPA